jgi:hypothetical protein
MPFMARKHVLPSLNTRVLMHYAYSIKSPQTYAVPCKQPPKWVNTIFQCLQTSTLTMSRCIYKKQKTLSKLQIYIPRVETVTGQHINYFHSDSRGEYNSDIYRTYLRERGIHHKITNTLIIQTPHKPWSTPRTSII